MTPEREALAHLLPLAEGFVRAMHSDLARYPRESVTLAMRRIVEARRILGHDMSAYSDEEAA